MRLETIGRSSVQEDTLGLVPRQVDYCGSLPVFKRFGDCGNHPQFNHLKTPPSGYYFSTLKDEVGKESLSSWKSLAGSAWRFGRSAMGEGASSLATAKFLWTRSLSAQLELSKSNSLAFFPSVPFILNQRPWVIEVEDTTSMMFPFLHNGQTSRVMVTRQRYFPIFKSLLKSDQCRGIITHVRSTAESIPVLFEDPGLAKKVTYIPLGIQPSASPVHRPKKNKGELRLLFSNSWHQYPSNFNLRGGLDLLAAFQILQQRYPQLELVVRSAVPDVIKDRFPALLQTPGLRLMEDLLEKSHWNDLIRSSDVFVLPSARIHVASILEAMSSGMALMVSDGWGIEEYVTHRKTGWVVKGRYGKVSWMDEKRGVLREDYSRMNQIDPAVVDGLVEGITRLIEEDGLRDSLVDQARTEVENRFHVRHWNEGFKAALDRAFVN